MDRKHVYLEEWQTDRVEESNINLSELVRDLLSAYFAEGRDKEKAAETIREARDMRVSQDVEKAVEAISTIDPADRTTSNPGVLNQAGKLGIPAARMIELVEEYEETGEVPEL